MKYVIITLLLVTLGYSTYLGIHNCLVLIEDQNKKIDTTTKNPKIDDAIQNHLVWDFNGHCYFITRNDVTQIIPVTDCDKK